MQVVRYNGTTSKNLGLDVISWSRPILPESRDQLEYAEGSDGSTHKKKPFGNRVIRITFRAFFDTEDEKVEVQKKVAEWLYSKEFTRLEFDDEPDIYYMGKVLDDTELQPELFTAEFTIIFTCQPLKFGAIRTESGNGLTGFLFTNGGTYESPPVITVTLNNGTADFQLALNGVSISYTSEENPIETGSVVVIDCKELELRIDGALKVLEVDGFFPDVVKGENNIICNTESTIKIDWQELHL